MLPAAAAIFINPPPILNQLRKINSIHQITPFSSPAFLTSKESVVHRSSVRPRKKMVAGSIETGIGGGGGGDERISPAVSAFEQETLIGNGGVFRQTDGGLHTISNRMSKWGCAATFGGVILLRHDAVSLWAAMGAVLNVILSVTLKRILNQERPTSEVSSGPGMPSSHAQSIFYALVFVILSVIEWLGLNAVSASLSLFAVAIGSYWSWLRVFLRYHTINQVIVGAVIGSVFSVFWFWAWDAFIRTTYNSSLWVQIVVIGGAVGFILGFILHVFQHWIKGEHQ